MEIVKLKLKDIVVSPTNPRKDFDKTKLAELLADMKLRGQLQPVIVRKKDKSYELVDGERRFRALELGEGETVDAVVREMTDLEAEEAQLVENGQPLKPLERARGYQGLIERHGLSVDDLALKVVKSRSVVYSTLALLRLEELPKKALVDGTIPDSTAKMLAHLPAELQVKATQEILAGEYGRGGPMTVRQARDHLQRNYFLDLRTALFDSKDAQLVPAAGACTTCTKRSDAQKDLFSDKKQPPLCLDSGCWNVKTRCGAQVVAAERGLKLLEDAEVESVFSRYGDVDGAAGYITKTTVHPTDGKGRTYAQLLTPAQAKDFTVLALNPKLDLVELLRTEGLKEAIEAAGKYEKREADKRGKSSSSPGKKLSAAQKAKAEAKHAKEAAELERRDKLAPIAVAAMVAAVEKAGPTKKILSIIGRGAVTQTEYLATRRNIRGNLYGCTEKEFAKNFGKLSPAQLLGLLFEASHDMTFESSHNFQGWSSSFQALAEQVGVDLKKLEKAELERELGSQPEGDVVPLKKAKAKKASKKPAKKKAA